ncbi:MAG: transcription termination/antitermination protein NusA [Planctomycetes bacterium]|nr:transcription termination/antitermination protein NusA [Planctomycetota bacterium]
MNTDLIRFVDAISRDKSIEKEIVFLDLEAAMLSAAQKAYEEAEDIQVAIDRVTGAITATVDGEPLDLKTLGRIAAQTAKQVMMQRIREDERNSIFEEYSQRVGTVVTGTVARFEGGALTVNLGRAEAFLPRSEQIPGDAHHPGERIRAMVLDVREEQNRVKIVLTQTHPDYIRKLFELEVPEVAERIIEIRALAREAGYRTKVAVSSIDSKVDPVGACVGVRGSRIRNIVDELGGEKIDIVRWNESSQVLISNSLKPAEVKEVFLCFELGRATVIVQEDQLSLAIGKRGQNVRLGARLTGWDIDISTPGEYDRNIDDMQKTLSGIEGVQDVMLDKMLAMGMVSLSDLSEVGVEPLVKDLELDEALAARIVEVAAEAAPRLEAERQAAKKAAAEAEAEAAKKAAEEAEAEAAAQTDADPAEDSVETGETPSDEPETPVSSDTTDSDTTDSDSPDDESGSTPNSVDSQTASETPAVQDVQTQSPTPAADTDVSAVKTGTVESSDPT